MGETHEAETKFISAQAQVCSVQVKYTSHIQVEGTGPASWECTRLTQNSSALQIMSPQLPAGRHRPVAGFTSNPGLQRQVPSASHFPQIAETAGSSLQD